MDYDTMYNEGKVLENQGRYEEAIKFYEEVRKSNAELATGASYLKASLFLEFGYFKEAIECCDEILLIDSESYGANNLKGNTLIKLGRYVEAINCLKKAESSDPTRAYLDCREGDILFSKMLFENAIEAYDNSLKKDPEFIRAKVGKAKALFRLNESEKSISIYDEILDKNPNNRTAKKGKEFIEEYKKCYTELNNFKDAFSRNRYEEAVFFANKARKFDSTEIDIEREIEEIVVNQMTILIHQGKYLEAKTAIPPKNFRIRNYFMHLLFDEGKSLSHQKKFLQSIVCYEILLKMRFSKTNSVLMCKAYSLKKLGRFEEEVFCYDEIHKRYPKHISCIENKAKALINLSKYNAALECYKQTGNILGKANMLVKLDKPEEALECYEKIKKNDLDFPKALLGKGEAFQILKRYAEALECYNTLLDLDKYYFESLIGRGNALLSLDKPEEALECYEKILKINSEHVKALQGKKSSELKISKK